MLKKTDAKFTGGSWYVVIYDVVLCMCYMNCVGISRLTQQNSYSISHLLDSDYMVTGE